MLALLSLLSLITGTRGGDVFHLPASVVPVSRLVLSAAEGWWTDEVWVGRRRPGGRMMRKDGCRERRKVTASQEVSHVQHSFIKL